MTTLVLPLDSSSAKPRVEHEASLCHTKVCGDRYSHHLTLRMFTTLMNESVMNVVPPALITQMMDQRINSTVYVKVLK